MKSFDVNVLVYAYREDSVHHAVCRQFIEGALADPGAFGLMDIVLSGFLRITTHPKIFKTPARLADALDFVAALRAQPQAITVRPGPRHWDLFTQLCEQVSATGNLIPDAYLAAMAIETGCDWVTTNRDFARFPGLRCVDPRTGDVSG